MHWAELNRCSISWLTGWPSNAVIPIIMTPPSPDERIAGATLKERTVGLGWQLVEPIEAAYQRGEVDLTEWH